VLDESKRYKNTPVQRRLKHIDAVVTDIDGTLTDGNRLINLSAIEKIRWLTAQNIPVILASGNTSCLMHGVSRFFGASGTFIAENGGVYRIGFSGPVTVHPLASRDLILEAFEHVHSYYESKGVSLNLYSHRERFSDIAFEKTMHAEEIRSILTNFHTPIAILDTGFAIHLQPDGISKGNTLQTIAKEMGLSLSNMIAVGDSVNDVEMVSAVGYGACVANSTQELKSAALFCASSEYGDGFVEIIDHFLGS
jgi:phosphoglycolate phosphatase (TIGR01487 family)